MEETEKTIYKTIRDVYVTHKSKVSKSYEI